MSAEPPGNSMGGNLPEDAAAAATVRRVVKICNQKGLHARAAARFVKTAHQFEAEIWVRKNGTIVSGRSIMGLMMLAAGPGCHIEIAAQGSEAQAAVDALAELVAARFDEER